MSDSTPSEKKIYLEASPQVSFPKEEENILNLWDRHETFQKTLEQTREGPFFSFYDGPPFATGLPHYGHILAGVLKDIVPRYWTMKGYHVPRVFGWDCHGVPVEYELNKKLNIQSASEVRAMGVHEYNEACRGIVDRYTAEWEATVRRVGRWVDMKNAYRTMDLTFMQSVWWVFKQLWDKGLIYEGYKVVPYSLGISTPLSNFEASQNYKMVQDPAITLAFRVTGEEESYFLAWTTTPWTLPSNLALAVGDTIAYVKVKAANGRFYYLAEALLEAYLKELGGAEAAEVVARCSGRELVGKTYEPLFPYFSHLKEEHSAFRVILSDHVTTEAGTGIVHMAPAFGEDDFYACQKEGIPIVNPVDDDGRFTSEVPDFHGKIVKEADPAIIERLKQEGKLLKRETFTHSYPFCERTDTPLIYKAVSSWFVKVEAVKESLIANNKATRWVPEHLRDGRFGNWLENARDWAISRNRFWGTPIPIWRNEEGEFLCIGSARELETLSGRKVTDLHIHHVDQIEIPSPTGKSPLKRVPGVLDCWFESGSMPVAQWGYPYVEATREHFEKGFPANFIAEGLDQTRGWFYTLMVIATALFDKPAFKHVVVNGLVLAEDGKKMSKRLRNYPDPMELLQEHGADALRLYMIDSPVVKAQDLKFSEKGVRDIVRKILLRWWNAYTFFTSYANIDGFRPRGDAKASPNILDRWVLSRLNSLAIETNEEMNAYRLYNVVPALVAFIEDLTNTYIRFNRRHFWQEGMPEDKRLAYETLYEVLVKLAKLMAPFTPFIAEMTYRNLARVLPGARESVHLESYPEGISTLVQPELEKAVARMEQLCLMGRNLREKIGVKGRIPLKSMRIIQRDPRLLEELKKLESYFVEELNVREVIYDSNEDAYVEISAKANFPKLGPRLGKEMKKVAGGIQRLSIEQILQLEAGEALDVEGHPVTIEDVEIRRAPRQESESFLTSQALSIELDPTVDEDQLQEGMAREIIRRVQVARKNAGFQLDDRIHLTLQCDPALRQAGEAFREMISSETLARELAFVNDGVSGEHTEETDVGGSMLAIGVKRV